MEKRSGLVGEPSKNQIASGPEIGVTAESVIERFLVVGVVKRGDGWIAFCETVETVGTGFEIMFTRVISNDLT